MGSGQGSLESRTVVEIAVTLGLDWVAVDLEHGHLDFKDVIGHIRTVRGSETSMIVRVPESQQGTVKRVLDMGAHGVLLPLMRTRADVETGFSYARYPPAGVRGVGGERAVKWGMGFEEYLKSADKETLVIPLIETRESVDNIDDILAIAGLEAIFFGPADLSASYGHLGAWEGPGVAERIIDVRDKAAAKGIASGIMSRSIADSQLRKEQGFGMVGIGSDFGLMIRALAENIKALGGDAKPHLWF